MFSVLEALSEHLHPEVGPLHHAAQSNLVERVCPVVGAGDRLVDVCDHLGLVGRVDEIEEHLTGQVLRVGQRRVSGQRGVSGVSSACQRHQRAAMVSVSRRRLSTLLSQRAGAGCAGEDRLRVGGR